jgi:dUTP pyrophosphatase
LFDRINIKVKQIENGVLPIYKRDGDVCLDCSSRIAVTIPAKSRKLVPLGFAMELPRGFEAVVRPRSGLTKDGIDNAIGTIDSNYRGEVNAIVINNTDKDYEIKEGFRICQLAIREVPIVTLEVVAELSNTERGSDGFGSSGI